jgi:hypothetical protein
MSRVFSFVCAATSALSFSHIAADVVSEAEDPAELSAFPVAIVEPLQASTNPAEEAPQAPMNQQEPLAAKEAGEAQEVVAAPKPAAVIAKPVVKEVACEPFTGKIKGKKVRLRLNADLDSHVIQEMNKNDLLTVVGEKGGFWAVEAPSSLKAYVFRSFVLDNVVEGNRVNVRLQPDLEAPIIGHLNAGERVEGMISALNNKWLEIEAPSHTHFYIAKEFVEKIGGAEIKHKMDQRKQAVQQLMEAANLISDSEMAKPFNAIDIERVTEAYSAIVSEYSDLPEQATRAKEALTALQEGYLQKKISFLENMKEESFIAKEIASHALTKEIDAERTLAKQAATDRMKLWEPVEEALYLSWAHLNDDQHVGEYYSQQKLNPVTLSGIVEAYSSAVKNKPGDFILKDKDLPVGYLYSTQVNLQDLVGKKVTLAATPRPNNHFAFPAYFVLSAE